MPGAQTNEPRTPSEGGKTVPVGSVERTMYKNHMPHHGMVEQRGMNSVPETSFHEGAGHRFGRMFPYLSPANHDISLLEALGDRDGPMFEREDAPIRDATTVPAGFTFLGQFIDHDITFDPTSSLERQNDPAALRNFRTAHLDLDSVYGSGPAGDSFLYQNPTPMHSGRDEDKLLIGRNDQDEPNDLPRNRQDVALTSDPRNDENLLVSQFHLAMCKFHNRVVDHLEADSATDISVFEEAQQLVRWHYQWVVLNDFLPTICDEDIVQAVRTGGRRYFTFENRKGPFIPVEFAGAAYRYGHSQVRDRYRVNDGFEGRLFDRDNPVDSLGAFGEVPANKAVDWEYFFELDGEPQSARQIDTLVSEGLFDLPFIPADKPEARRSLPARNLVRGRRLGLPSGPAVARRMGIEPLSNDELGLTDFFEDQKAVGTEAPLWYYVLAEANQQTDGEHLGTVGSRIVAEVLVGLIESDYSSFLTIQPDWKPILPAPHAGDDDFSAADLLSFALELH